MKREKVFFLHKKSHAKKIQKLLNFFNSNFLSVFATDSEKENVYNGRRRKGRKKHEKKFYLRTLSLNWFLLSHLLGKCCENLWIVVRWNTHVEKRRRRTTTNLCFGVVMKDSHKWKFPNANFSNIKQMSVWKFPLVKRRRLLSFVNFEFFHLYLI